MPRIISSLSRLTSFRQLPYLDRYHLSVVTSPAELEYEEVVPLEIRYIMAAKPARREVLRSFLERGIGIGVRTVDKTPERVLQAVERISILTQHNTIFPWLERLLRHEEIPVFSEAELRSAEAKGIDLYTEVRVIMERRFEFKKIILIGLENQVVPEEDQRIVMEINRELIPHALNVVVNRIVFDNAHTRTEVAQSVIKALLIVGPIAHALETVLTGIGKVFAATADDVLSEIAELFALRGSGFSWKQLARRSFILIPVFILATYGAFRVEPLIHAGHYALAGVIFGSSAVALSLTTAIQSIFLYRRSYIDLLHEGKVRLSPGHGVMWYAIRQDFTNPARLGLFIGALCSPFFAAVVFGFFPEWTTNGWILALLGSTESIVAGCTVIGAARVNKWRFVRRVQQAITSSVSSSTGGLE